MAQKKAMRKSKRARIDFSPTTAIEMYKAGKRVAEIAQAMGYHAGTGQNRVRYALEKAGIYKKGTTGRTSAPKAKAQPSAAAATAKDITLPIPETPEVALAVCLRTIDVNIAKLNLDELQRAALVKQLMGGIAANYGITEFHVRRPVVALDENRVKPYLITTAAATA